MERDTIIAHGAAAFLKERLHDMSDPYKMKICNDCGDYTVISNECHNCGNDEVSSVVIPYSTKLLIQNLQALNIKVQLKPKI